MYARDYPTQFTDYARALNGPRAVKDWILALPRRSLLEKLGLACDDASVQELLRRLAGDILASPKQRQQHYNARFLQPLVDALKSDGYVFGDGKLSPM